MLPYCLKCRKNTESKNPKVVKTKNGKMFLSKCAVCNSKKSKLIKEQLTRRLFSSLGTRAHLIQVPLLGPILF